MKHGLITSCALLCAAFGSGCEASVPLSGKLQGPTNSTPAQLQESFDALEPGTLPAGWKIETTQPRGPQATWMVKQDASAPSPSRSLALERTNHQAQDSFNLCWTPAWSFLDGTIEASVRADAGEVDQGGGLIWRARDANNYYVVRFNPLESNYRVYYVKDGQRVQLATAAATARAGSWHRVKLEHIGDHIRCWLDDQPLLDVHDATLAAPGGVGVWTKADARTSFDSLRITARDK